MNKKENLFRGLLLDFDEDDNPTGMTTNEWVYGSLTQQYDYRTVADINGGSTFGSDKDGFVEESILQHTFIQWDGMPSWGGDDIFEVDPKTVGQKTGRQDREGEDIYDSDIAFYYRKKIHCLIYWDDKLSAFMICGKGFKDFLACVDAEHDLKRTGTFFDDPEMEQRCNDILKIVR